MERRIIDLKTGLVLEGGAMRGMFTAGVLDVMMENDIKLDGAVGVSAGATFGCNYKSGQIGRTLRYNKRFCSDYRYGSFKSVLKSGDIYEVKLCYEDIPLKYDVFDDEAFQKNPIPFYCVCTDVKTGDPVYHRCETGMGDDLMWIRASASMPLVSRIVEVDGYSLLDGGISDSIPIRFFEQKGYDRNVVVLTQPRDFVKKKNSLLPLIRIMMRKYPEVVNAIAVRHEIYNATTDYIKHREKEEKAFVISPDSPLNVSSIESNPDELQRVYDHGREVMERNLDSLREFIKKQDLE